MFKAVINVLNTKYTSWSTEPADIAVDVNNVVTVLKAIKAAGNYGAVITFDKEENVFTFDKEEKGGDKDDF